MTHNIFTKHPFFSYILGKILKIFTKLSLISPKILFFDPNFHKTIVLAKILCYTLSMRILSEKQIEEAVYVSAKKMCFGTSEKVENALKTAYEKESGYAKDALFDILENIKISKDRHLPLCQDTGICIVFCSVGSSLVIEGDFERAINNGIARAYKDEYLRKSVVNSPLLRVNTGDNTPAIIHTKIVSGDQLKIAICPKGAGSENMGAVKMLNPSDGIDGIVNFVLQTVKNAGGKACPPLIVGVGIGGDMEKCALLSKEALLRQIDDVNSKLEERELEERLLEEINKLNIGAMGLKGKTTALAVKVNTYPCHIASLPVAVSLMCHAVRKVEFKV